MITIKRKDFETLNDVSLIWTCIGPTITQIRGKDFVVKSEAYAPLNPGQRALLMFQVLYGHSSNGVEEFFSHLSYLLINKGVWSQLKKGMKYFGDYDMAQILEKMDIVYQSLKAEDYNENTELHSVYTTCVYKNAELSESISNINKSLSETLPLSIKMVASYIRENTHEFVQLIE